MLWNQGPSQSGSWLGDSQDNTTKKIPQMPRPIFTLCGGVTKWKLILCIDKTNRNKIKIQYIKLYTFFISLIPYSSLEHSRSYYNTLERTDQLCLFFCQFGSALSQYSLYLLEVRSGSNVYQGECRNIFSSDRSSRNDNVCPSVCPSVWLKVL